MRAAINAVPNKYGLLFCILTLFVMTGCSSENDSESQALLNKIINHFSFSEETIPLLDVTDFSWENVCAYYADDSSPYATRDWVEKKTSQKKQASDHAQMALIFSTKNSEEKIYIFENTDFKINKQHYYFASVTDGGDNYGESCFDVSEAKLKRSSGTSGTSKYSAIELEKGK